MTYIVEYTSFSGKSIPMMHKVFKSADAANTHASNNVTNGNYRSYAIKQIDEGYKVMPPMNPKYTERSGLEGPFTTLSGKVVYYDPKEGSYYDPDTDMYMPYDEFQQYDKDYSSMKDERDDVKESAEALRQIVTDKNSAKVNGVLVDLFTASAIMQVYDAVNDANKEKMDSMLKTKSGLLKMADFAMTKVESATNEGCSPHKKGTKKYKAHMAAKHASMNEAGGYYTQPVYDMIKQHGYPKVMQRLLSALDADVIQDFISRDSDLNESEKRWKQTSMSPAEAEKEYGKENVKVKKGALRNGDDMVEVFVEGFKIRDKSRGYGVSDKTYKTRKQAQDAAVMKSASSGGDYEVIEETLSPEEKKLVNQMYNKDGTLTALGKRVMNHGKTNKVTEGVADEAVHMERDHEVQMARSDLYKIANYAVKLHKMLKNVSEEQGIQGWMQAKITKSADYMSSVAHTLEYDMMEKHQSEPMAEAMDASKYHCEDCGCQMHNCKPECNCSHDSHDETGSWWKDADGNGVPDAFESVQEMTSAGGMATVAAPMGKTKKRNKKK